MEEAIGESIVEKVPPKNIGWKDLDKKKFFLTMPLCSVASQLLLFPSNLVKTRIQTASATGDLPYKSTMDAFRTIYRREGVLAFYKGFGLSLINVFTTGPIFITTFEVSRAFYLEELQKLIPEKYLSHQTLVNIAAGLGAPTGTAAVLTTATPIDVMVQRRMVQRTQKGVVPDASQSSNNYSSSLKEIFRKEGIRGYYRGYWIALANNIPTSGIVWSSYYQYQHWSLEIIAKVLPSDQDPKATIVMRSVRTFCDVMMAPFIAGVLAGTTGAVATNPIDLARAQIQVREVKKTFLQTLQEHYARHGWRGFYQGTVARAVNMATTFAIVMPSYEILKRLSMKD